MPHTLRDRRFCRNKNFSKNTFRGRISMKLSGSWTPLIHPCLLSTHLQAAAEGPHSVVVTWEVQSVTTSNLFRLECSNKANNFKGVYRLVPITNQVDTLSVKKSRSKVTIKFRPTKNFKSFVFYCYY